MDTIDNLQLPSNDASHRWWGSSFLHVYLASLTRGIGSTGNGFPRVWDIRELSTVSMSVEDSIHYSLEGPDADAEWEALAPSAGMIYLGNPPCPFGLSMFHQLRCLNILRQDFVNKKRGASVRPDLDHHCLNYMRQMVLCRSDLALDVVLGKPAPNVYPNIYQCNDWTKVYDEVHRNQEEFRVGKKVRLSHCHVWKNSTHLCSQWYWICRGKLRTASEDLTTASVFCKKRAVWKYSIWTKRCLFCCLSIHPSISRDIVWIITSAMSSMPWPRLIPIKTERGPQNLISC